MSTRSSCAWRALAGVAAALLAVTGTAAEETGDQEEVAEVVTATPPDTTSVVDSHPQDSPEDRGFVLTTRDGKSGLRFRGSIRLNGIYDIGGLQTRAGFSTYDIPVGVTGTTEPRFQMDAWQTRFAIEASRETSRGDAFMRIEADFRGDGGSFRLRHAYGSVGRWLAGQTWTTFGDVSALPLTVDFEGPNSAVSLRTAQIRYTWRVEEDLDLALGVESPSAELADTLQAAFQSTPDLVVRLRKKGTEGHFQFAAIWRNLSYRDSNRKLQYDPGYGGVVSGRIRLTQKSEALFQALYGQAISRFVLDLSGRGLDLIFNPDTQQFEAVQSMGGYVSFEYTWTPTLTSNFVGALTNVNNKSFEPDDAFNHSQYFAANLFYDVVSGLRVGIEGLWGRRVDKNGESGNAGRIQFMMYYDF